MSGIESEQMCTCGYPDGSFACKIRHITLMTGDAKAARDFEPKGAPRGSGVTSYQNR